MSNNERRIVPRKAYAIPVRFNVISQELAAVGPRGKMGIPRGASKFLETIPLPQQGEIGKPIGTGDSLQDAS